jgi:hypothetical protein
MSQKVSGVGIVSSFLQRTFVHEKMNNWAGFIVVVMLASSFGYLIASDFVTGMGVFGLILGISLLLICILNAEYGLYVILFYAFASSTLSRFVLGEQVPVGVGMDILVFTTFLGLFFIKENLKKNSEVFFKSKPVIFYSIILIYLGFELLNPLAHSFAGWFQIMRKVWESFLIVYIAFIALNSKIKIRRFLKVLFFFAFISGLYGCFQEWHGLMSFELGWVHSDPKRVGLIYIFGTYRKFSVFSGPTEFGILMAACSLLYILIGINERNKVTKVMYILGSIFMLLGMSYSGTRTANAMLVGGFFIYILLSINKLSTKIFAFVSLMVFLFLLYAPIYSSVTLIRFRTTFSASEDASYNVRETNRQRIQPYIYSHPFGGGVYTTGEMGKKYNPGHPLAGFPTDSSFLNKALETGWIGMILTCIFYFSSLAFIIRGYFTSNSEQTKSILAASLAFFFSFYIGEIAQEAVGLFANMAVLFPLFGIIIRLRALDKNLTADRSISKY